jgi:hypothetical protein
MEPTIPLLGLIEVTVGTDWFTVKVTDVVLYPGVSTATLFAPISALDAMVKTAVISVELTTMTSLTLTPMAPTKTVAGETKFVPVKITGTVVPVSPLLGLIDVKVGAGGAMAKLTAPLVPPAVVTVTPPIPAAAFPAIANMAVIWVEFTTLTLLTVTPAMPTFTVAVAPGIKFVPVNVTGTVDPAGTLLGLIDVSVGAGVVAHGAMVYSVAGDSFCKKRGIESLGEALGSLDRGA